MPCPYQAATPTVVVYWSGMGCGHGMPCPYIATGYSVNAVSVSGGNATVVVYWSGMGCGHGMPCPYIWRCCRPVLFPYGRLRWRGRCVGGPLRGTCGGGVYDPKRRTPSACLLGANHIAALRAFWHLGDAALTQRRDTACRVRIRRQRRPWWCTGREWVADTACRVPT